MEENQEKKIEIKLERHLWPDERAALEEKKKKKRNTVVLCLLVVAMLCGSLLLGVYLGEHSKKQTVISRNQTPELQRFESIYNTLLKDWYFSSDLDSAKADLIDRAVTGMIGTDLDPHSSYMTAEEAEAFTSSIDLGFVGIGVQYQVVDAGILIEKIYYGAPAYEAGLRVGDVITEVDHQSIIGWETSEIASHVQGENGTVVNITYMRANDINNVDIVRGPVENSIYGEIKGDVGYVEMLQFSSTAPQEVEKYLKYFQENGISRLIIDVRDDGGGYLTSLIGVANLLVERGQIILTQEYTDGSVVQSVGDGENVYHFDKVVILGNSGSASASEALIGCLTQNEVATFVGTKTYGKSTIQVPSYYTDGSALKYTSGIWKTPNGSIINRVGIYPDVEVELHPVLNMNVVSLQEDETLAFDQVDGRIVVLENCLDFLGYDVDRVDGYFSKSVESAIRQFQSDYQLEVTGIINQKTASLLCSEVTRHYSNDTDRYDLQMIKAMELVHE